MNLPLFLFAAYKPTSVVTATDTATGYDAEAVLFASEDESWQPADIIGTKDIVIDLQEQISMEVLGLVGENMAGITVEVRASTDNFAASDDQLLAATVISSALNAAWEELTSSGNYSYLKLRFSDFPSDLEICFISIGPYNELAYLVNDFDPENLTGTGKHLVSPSGHYNGSTVNQMMQEFPIDFGQVTDAEYIKIKLWRDNAVKAGRGFVFVPDVDESECFFTWAKDFKFSAPRPNGVRKVEPVTIITRAGE